MCAWLNRVITGAGALQRDEGDGGHSRIAWAIRRIRGMCDNKAYFLPLLVSSDLLRLWFNEKDNVSVCGACEMSINNYTNWKHFVCIANKSHNEYDYVNNFKLWSAPGGCLLTGLTVMCGPKVCVFSPVLVWHRGSILTILVWNRVWCMVHGLCSQVLMMAQCATCFLVWNFELETLCSFESYVIKAYKHCL